MVGDVIQSGAIASGLTDLGSWAPDGHLVLVLTEP